MKKARRPMFRQELEELRSKKGKVLCTYAKERYNKFAIAFCNFFAYLFVTEMLIRNFFALFLTKY